MRIHKKIPLYFAGLVALLLVFAAAVWRYEYERREIGNLDERRSAMLRPATALRQSATDRTHAARAFIATGDSVHLVAYQDARVAWEQASPSLVRFDLQPQLTGRIGRQAEAAARMEENAIARRREDDIAHSQRWSTRLTVRSDIVTALYDTAYLVTAGGIVRDLDRWSDTVQEHFKADMRVIRERQLLLRKGIMILAAIILLYTMAGWWVLRRRVARPLTSLLATLERRGSVIRPEDIYRKGEIGALSLVYEDLVQQLRNTLMQSHDLKKQLKGRSDELLDARTDLQSYARLLDVTFNRATDSMLTFAADGTIRSFNASAERLLGYTADEILQRHVGAVLSVQGKPLYHDAVETGTAEFLRRLTELRSVDGTRKDGIVISLAISVGEFRVGDELRFVAVIRRPDSPGTYAAPRLARLRWRGMTLAPSESPRVGNLQQPNS